MVGGMEMLDWRRKMWEHDRNLATASDLISTAIILNKRESVMDVIDFVSNLNDVPVAIKNSISILDEAHIDMHLSNAFASDSSKIAYIKDVLKRWPRNAIIWTELALLYSRVGVLDKARKCVNVAVSLAPNNRYVLRCASRFFIHMDDPKQVCTLLRKCDRTKHDPWLLAAEISASQIAGKSSPMLKTGSKLLQSQQFGPRDITELAASLGTNELFDGSNKKARGLFELGAQSPNDNVKAQIQWLRMDHESVLPRHDVGLNDEYDFEARALHCRKQGDWEDAIHSCGDWGTDEMFSERPFCLGSYIAIEALGDGVRGEEIAKKGLSANQHDYSLLNNLTVALALQGKVEKADDSLKNATKMSDNSVYNEICLKSTKGLIEYRRQKPDIGRSLYQEAIILANKQNDVESARRAALYMTMEELEIGTDESVTIANIVLEIVKKPPSPESESLISRIKDKMKRESTKQTSPKQLDILNLTNSIP